jgi:hypothetical protein
MSTAPPLFLTAAVACFDMVSGIRVTWVYSDSVDATDLTNLFKIVLSNVHRQPEQSYAESSVSTVELPTLGWFLANSIFAAQSGKRAVYHSVGLVLSLSAMPRAPEFVDVLASWSRVLTRVARGLIAQSCPLARLADVVDALAADVATVARASIARALPFELAPADLILYARLLTAHLQAQMTVVIEAAGNRPEHAQQLARFLSHFLLPHQRRFSTLEVLARPSAHLYVQCVEAQGQAHVQDQMLMFDRPVAWVRLPDRRDGPVKIQRSEAPLEEQRACHEQFVDARFLQRADADDAGLSKKIGEIRERAQVRDVTVPAPWCVARVALLLETPDDARRLFCAEQLAAIVRTAVALVALVHTRPGDGQPLGEPVEREIRAALRLVGSADWDMAVAVARLYDKDITAKMSGGRRAQIRPFSSLLGPRKT